MTSETTTSESTPTGWPPYFVQAACPIPMPFAPASRRLPPLVCMVCGCLVENTLAGMNAHKRWHDVLTAGGIGA